MSGLRQVHVWLAVGRSRMDLRPCLGCHKLAPGGDGQAHCVVAHGVEVQRGHVLAVVVVLEELQRRQCTQQQPAAQKQACGGARAQVSSTARSMLEGLLALCRSGQHHQSVPYSCH